MTAPQLAALVEQLLDLQRDFFKSSGPRREDLLGQCKAAERHLRKVCDGILRPAAEPPKLFDNGRDVAH